MSVTATPHPHRASRTPSTSPVADPSGPLRRRDRRQPIRAGRQHRNHQSKQDRRELRQLRREIRQRLATPPPVYLVDDRADSPSGSLEQGGFEQSARRLLRTRWRLLVAALPLMVAAVLFLITVVGDGGGDPGREVRVAETAEPMAISLPSAASSHPVQSPGPTPALAPSPAPSPDPAPAPPRGHQAVALRFAAPDAVALVAVGDRIDVVGLSGDVLTAGVEVLQDRSTPQAAVLVVAVPEADAPDVAAAAAAQDLTLLVAPPAD